MPDYTQFDPRVDSLVMEVRTEWAADCPELSAEEKASIAKNVQREPYLARSISYERTYTGFIRTIVITPDDVARIQRQNTGELVSAPA